MDFRNRDSEETLLVRKVAASAKQVTATSQSLKLRSRLRNDIERQLRRPNNEDSIQVYIRLLKATHVTTKADIEEAIPRLQAPPSTPIPSLAGRNNFDDDDVTIYDSNERSSSLRRKKAWVVNNDNSQSNSHNASWLTLRGRNIQLQHQDHVRNALSVASPRLVQSASPTSRGRYHKTNQPSPRLYPGNPRCVSTTPSDLAIRAQMKSPSPRHKSARVIGTVKTPIYDVTRSSAIGGSGYYGNKPVSIDEQVDAKTSRKVQPLKSLVIKVPYTT